MLQKIASDLGHSCNFLGLGCFYGVGGGNKRKDIFAPEIPFNIIFNEFFNVHIFFPSFIYFVRLGTDYTGDKDFSGFLRKEHFY